MGLFWYFNPRAWPRRRKPLPSEYYTGRRELWGQVSLILLLVLPFIVLYSGIKASTEAKVISQQTLEGYEKVPAPENPNTICSISMLGAALCYQGKYKEAKAMLRRALALSKKVLGLEHPQSLSYTDNLVLVLQYQGKYAEAEFINQQAL
jgi:tetratricopeptide (TPR) repeat protein